VNDYLGGLKIRKSRMLNRELDHILLDWRDCFAWGAEPMEHLVPAMGASRTAGTRSSPTWTIRVICRLLWLVKGRDPVIRRLEFHLEGSNKWPDSPEIRENLRGL
jgi:hypothetical protein